MERVATCHCGQLRCITTGEPLRSYLCHCAACQRRTGSAMHWGSHWNRSAVRVEGEATVYTRRGASGFDLHSHFCPTCGTTVMMVSDRMPEACTIANGCFADPDFPPPSFGIWEDARQPWLEAASVVEHHRQGRLPVPGPGSAR